MTFCKIPRLGGRREHRRKRLHGGSRIHKPERLGEPLAKCWLSGDKIPPHSGGGQSRLHSNIVADVGKEDSQQIADLVMSDGRVSAKWADKCVVWREQRSANAPDWHPVERPIVSQCQGVLKVPLTQPATVSFQQKGSQPGRGTFCRQQLKLALVHTRSLLQLFQLVFCRLPPFLLGRVPCMNCCHVYLVYTFHRVGSILQENLINLGTCHFLGGLKFEGCSFS